MGIHDGHREKMRQRFIKAGLDAFADHEALELLLYYAIPRQDMNPTAHALLERFKTLEGVLSASAEDLQTVPGIGAQAAVLLSLVSQLDKRIQQSKVKEVKWVPAMASPDEVGKFLLPKFAMEEREVIYQLCLDRKGKLLACKRLGEGGTASAELNIRHMVENALKTNASAVILAHNHPSGVALPSNDDYTTTERAKVALEAIDVCLVDHIIVADGDYVSMAESGYLA